MLEINSSQLRRSEFTKYLIDYMRVFFFDTFSSTPTAASSNDQIQKFYVSLKNVGVRWFTETIHFSQELYSLVYELHYPPPPKLYFSGAL